MQSRRNPIAKLATFPAYARGEQFDETWFSANPWGDEMGEPITVAWTPRYGSVSGVSPR